MASPNIVSALGARFVGPLQSPIQISATYQINGGTAIAAGASVTDTGKTFTGVLTTDEQVAVGFDDALKTALAAVGIVLTGVEVTAANTVSLTWANTTAQSQTPPATSQQFWAVRLGTFFGK